MHLNLQKSSIKNKLFGITIEFKEFEFQVNLWIEFTKNDEFLKETHGSIHKK